jgi:hypothetical protein
VVATLWTTDCRKKQEQPVGVHSSDTLTWALYNDWSEYSCLKFSAALQMFIARTTYTPSIYIEPASK